MLVGCWNSYNKSYFSILSIEKYCFLIIIYYYNSGEYGNEKVFTLFYVGTSTGQVYKISQWQEGDSIKSQLLDVFQVLIDRFKIAR